MAGPTNSPTTPAGANTSSATTASSRRERLRELVEEVIGATFSNSYNATSTLVQEMIEEDGQAILSEIVEELAVLSDAVLGTEANIKELAITALVSMVKDQIDQDLALPLRVWNRAR